VIGPILDADLQGFVDVLTELGIIGGEILSPFLNILGIALMIVVGVLKITLIPVLQVVAAVFKWLNNVIIVPFGNAVIDVINGLITMINYALGWAGVHIALLKHLQAVEDDYAANQEDLAGKIKDVNDAMDKVRSIFDEKRKAIDEAYDKNIESIKRLLEVGAMSETAYDAAAAAYNSQRKADLDALTKAEDEANESLKGILDKLQDGIDIKNLDQLIAAIVGEYDEGSTSIPRTGLAKVHKGETIIPRSFAEGLRRGDLTLGSGSGGSSGNTVINLVVKGSIQTENDITDALAKALERRRARGQLPQEATA
jgi:hypothetical protein